MLAFIDNTYPNMIIAPDLIKTFSQTRPSVWQSHLFTEWLKSDGACSPLLIKGIHCETLIFPCVTFRWPVRIIARYHWRWGERRENEFGPSILTKSRSVWLQVNVYSQSCQIIHSKKFIWWSLCCASSSKSLHKVTYFIIKKHIHVSFKFFFNLRDVVLCVLVWKINTSLLYKFQNVLFAVVCSQIIVERAPRSRAPELDKKKYLVPSDLTGDFFTQTWITGVKKYKRKITGQFILTFFFHFFWHETKQLCVT